VNPFHLGALETLRRRLARHQDRPPHSSVPLWRLLAEEVSLLLRRLARRNPMRLWLPAMLIGLTVAISYSDATPGPVLQRDAWWIASTALAAETGTRPCLARA
jgi:hypothetical protein